MTPPLSNPRTENPVLVSSRREAIFVAVMWVATAIYTLGFAGARAYRTDAHLDLVLGMPGWVVWGIWLPWGACLVVTCWFALRGIRDEDLGVAADEPEREEPHAD